MEVMPWDGLNVVASTPMNHSSEHLEELLFEALLSQPDLQQRQAMLDKLAQSSPAMHARVRALLEANGETQGVLTGLVSERDQLLAAISGSPSARDESEVTSVPPMTPGVVSPAFGVWSGLMEGTRIGRYKLLEKLGEGGCGVVFVAQQYEPVQRRVALKVIKPGMDTKAVLARFDMERQALAMMDHPNISKVFDAGSTETGRPYFVMELVLGSRITDFCDQNRLTIAERVSLFIQVCGAIQHAHQKGIIHRDIKPSNILITRVNDVPVPKVIDFGVAKAVEGRLTDSTVYTQVHQIIGTPSYMSPEQVEMTGEGIDTRSDIYALGVLLYELMAGKTPFDGKELISSGVDSLRRVIREREPLRPSACVMSLSDEDRNRVALSRGAEPSKLGKMLKSDLDWIAMKCLEKDRSRRYETANGLAADLLRYLNHEVVVARPPSPAYRFARLARRYRGAFIAIGSVLMVSMVGGAISFSLYLREAAALKRVRAVEAEQSRLLKRTEEESLAARSARDIASRNLYAADVQLAYQAIQEGNLGRARTLLKRFIPAEGGKDERGFEWHYFWQLTSGEQRLTLRDHSNSVSAVAWSPDHHWLASGGMDDMVYLRNATNGAVVVQMKECEGSITALSFSPDSRQLAVSSDDARVRILDVPRGKVRWMITNGSPRAVFSPKASLLAVGIGGNMWAEGNGEVHLWDTEERKRIAILPESGDRAAFSPDGRLLATANFQERVSIFDVATRKRLHFLGSIHRAMSLVFARDGTSLIIGTGQGEILQWSFAQGTVRRIRDPQEGNYSSDFITGLSLAPDGVTLAASRQLHEVELWDLKKARRTDRLAGHESEVWGLAFSPDGHQLATASFDRTVRLWDTDRVDGNTGMVLPTIPIDRNRRATYPLFTPDGKHLAVMVDGWAIHVLDARTLKRVHRLADGNLPAGMTPDGKEMVSISEDHNTILRWDVKAGRFLGSARLDPLNQNPSGEELVSRDARLLYVQRGQQSADVFDTATGKLLRQLPFPFAARIMRLSGAADLMMLGGNRGEVEVVDLVAGKTVWSKKSHSNAVVGGDFSPDGRWLATGSWDQMIHVWNVATGEKIGTLNGHKAGVLEVAFSGDSRTLASSSDDWTVKLWHVETLREMATVPMTSKIYCLRFSPDSSQLIVSSATTDTPVYVWRGFQ